jgi:phage recombination protein Bet
VKNETTSVSLSQKFGFTESQLDLVKRTVAKNATNDELELFFYRCKELGLNPLMPGQVYFLKFGTAPGTIVVGIDGFRARAQRSGKLSGIKRGVIRNEQGVCTGGWADVYRKDWDHPAHIEVSLAEYNDPRRQTWKQMPESMIQKVAEVAAIRMAFPEELGGIYSQEEMDQADRGKTVKNVESEIGDTTPSLAQIRRLFTIAAEAGVTQERLKEILLSDYGKSSTKDLTMKEYNELCIGLASEVQEKIENSQVSENSENLDKARAKSTFVVNPKDIQEAPEPGSDMDEEPEGVAKDVPWAKYRESHIS